MLDILSMLGDEGGSKLGKALAELGNYLRPDKILDGLFALVLGVNVYLKLGTC